MHRLTIPFALVAALFLLPALPGSSAFAQQAKSKHLAIEHPWARATPPGAQVGAGYLVVRNTGKQSDALVGGSTDVAETVEVHAMAHVQGMMEMRPVPKLAIAPGKSVTFQPGGYHLMLMGLKRPLREGEHISVTLRFERAGAVKVQLEVRGVAAGSPHMQGHGDMKGGSSMQGHGDMNMKPGKH